MIETGIIAEYISSGENCSLLEEIVKKEKEACESIPECSEMKIRKIEDAKAVLHEAKGIMDEFLGIEPACYNPSIEFKRISMQNIALGGLSLALITAGTAIAFTEYKEISSMLLATGITGSTWLAIREFMDKDRYDREGNRIICTKAGRQKMLYTLMHEYAHAATTDKFGSDIKHFCFDEGFAMGSSSHIAQNYMNGQCAKASLKLSSRLLEMASEFAIKYKENPNNFKAAYLLSSINAGSVPLWFRGTANGIGYALFRLAEEKHGPCIYREVFNGNDKILFE